MLTQSDRTRLERLLTLAESGRLPARVHAVLPLARAADAHRAMAEAGTRGRYVLQP
ncbi:zinc-binding dehydrogenase [Nocardia cyriacigeorgica]|uniref:zinc-binding dehydrogenase n=1 Tax=Nocardia cyriacigeorgica TaxID=135487 RepID=UPI0034DB74EC